MCGIIFRAKVRNQIDVGWNELDELAIEQQNWWLFGTPIPRDFVSNSHLFLTPNKTGEYVQISVLPETIGQFIGLFDNTKWNEIESIRQDGWLRNYSKEAWKGIPIFTGDIIKVYLNDAKTAFGVIKYGYYGLTQATEDKTHLGFYIDWIDKSLWYRQDIGFWFREYPLEVIGNRYDNRDLLTKK